MGTIEENKKLTTQIEGLVKNLPNDYELGAAVRKLINENTGKD